MSTMRLLLMYSLSLCHSVIGFIEGGLRSSHVCPIDMTDRQKHSSSVTCFETAYAMHNTQACYVAGYPSLQGGFCRANS